MKNKFIVSKIYVSIENFEPETLQLQTRYLIRPFVCHLIVNYLCKGLPGLSELQGVFQHQ